MSSFQNTSPFENRMVILRVMALGSELVRLEFDILHNGATNLEPKKKRELKDPPEASLAREVSIPNSL